MTSWFKAFVAAACGGLIGALLGLELKAHWHYAWTISLLLGIAIGFVGATPVAFWRDAKGAIREAVYSQDFPALAQMLRSVGLFYLAASVCLLSVVLYAGVPLSLLTGSIGPMMAIFVIGFALITLSVVITLLGATEDYTKPGYLDKLQKEDAGSWQMMWEGSPIKAPYWIIQGAWTALKFCWTWAKFCGTIALALWRGTISDLRLSAAIGGASGAVMGYQVDHALMGAVVGAFAFCAVWSAGTLFGQRRQSTS